MIAKCRECGKEVSTSAQRCPHCGALVYLFSFSRVLILLIIILLFCWFMANR